MASNSKIKLYSYWRSSCSWRVRIALLFKGFWALAFLSLLSFKALALISIKKNTGLEYEYIPVNLLKGDQFTPEFKKLNPLSYVPVLDDDDAVIADSFAIIMFLDDKYPQHPLLPQDLQKRALNYQVANIVASNIQPLQNLVVLNHIEEKLGSDEKLLWAQHHIKKGFAALEKLLAGHAGKYATGDEVALADVFLAPQIGATKRFNIDMAEFPLLKRLNDAYADLPAFQSAVPGKQPDAPDYARS